MRHQGNSAGGYREKKRWRAGVWRQSYKVYKESVFLYNNKKTKGYKSGCIYKTRRYCFTCKRVPDQTGDKTERGTGRGWRARCVQKRREGGEGSSPSINLQAGAGVAHARERSKACAGAGCAWGSRGAGSQECPPVSAPWRLALRASARKGVLDGDRGTGGANWPQREGGNRSLESAMESWRSPLGAPLLRASDRPF